MLVDLKIKEETKKFFEREIKRTKMITEVMGLIDDMGEKLLREDLTKEQKKEYKERKEAAMNELEENKIVAEDLEKILILTK